MSKNFPQALHTADGSFRTSAEPLDDVGDRWAQWVRNRRIVHVVANMPIPPNEGFEQTSPIDTVDGLLGGESTAGFHYVAGRIIADVPGTLYVEVSEDLTNWDTISEVTHDGSEATVLDPIFICGRYVRFRYENGSQGQQDFRLVQVLV